MPADFPEMFTRLGWEAIEEHYATGQTIVKRWLREAGELDLIERRRSYLRKVYAANGRPNIPGRKPGALAGGLSEMSASNPALKFMPVRRARRRFDGKI